MAFSTACDVQKPAERAAPALANVGGCMPVNHAVTDGNFKIVIYSGSASSVLGVWDGTSTFLAVSEGQMKPILGGQSRKRDISHDCTMMGNITPVVT